MDKNLFSGFQAVVESAFESNNEGDNVEVNENKGAADEGITDADLSKLFNPEAKEPNNDDKTKEEDEPNGGKSDDEPNTDDNKNTENNTDDDGVDPVTEVSEEGAAVVGGFFDALSEELGWTDVTEEEKPKTAEELVNYFSEVIKNNSKPTFANEEIEKLDQFVKNGGDIKNYLSTYSELNLNEVNLEEDESAQKTVLRQFLKEKGFSDKQIDNKIAKYDEVGILQDESEDALEALKELKAALKEELLERQKIEAESLRKSLEEYFTSVVSEIKELNNIRGVKIPEKDKTELYDYLFKQDANGVSQYQKDFNSNVKNLIESAYFTMKGDTLLEKAKKEGSNTALNNFKKSLQSRGIDKRSKRDITKSSNESIWNSLAKTIRG